jgi:hypothetical protein
MKKQKTITHQVDAVVRLILWHIWGKRLESMIREAADNSCEHCPKESEGYRHGCSLHVAGNMVYGFFHL